MKMGYAIMSERFREKVLLSFGAEPEVIKELLAYNRNLFNLSSANQSLETPLEDEKFVSYWHQYKVESEEYGLFNTLKRKLVQLRFPIRAGISQTDNYLAATRKGILEDEVPETSGLQLKHAEQLELQMHKTQAGTIPIIISRCREDFVTLLQALIYKNEPVKIPDSMGACMIAGYNNWHRIRDYRRKWEVEQEEKYPEPSWNEEFTKLIQRKELYQDSFILLNDGPYSAVPAKKMGMTESEWREKSLLIRREHESTHYLTKRFFSSMQNNMLDEFIADYAGIVAANGCYKADWFLRFIGLEDYPEYRKGARLENYCQKQFLSNAAFSILQSLLVSAATNLQNAEEKYNREGKIVQMVFSLCSLTLEELASEQATKKIEEAIHRYQLTTKDREGIIDYE